MLTNTKKATTAPADTLLHFEEGLIGFSDCRKFVLMENADIAPLRRLQSTERPDVAFFVIDPGLVLNDYQSLIPAREWQSLDVAEPTKGIALAICAIRETIAECTGNLQAPILVNVQRMTGKQIILTETQLTTKHPLINRPV
jgi:flagellar assembly factor FliW